MIYIEVDENFLVDYFHYKPFDKECGLNKSKEELETQGYLFDSIVEPESIEGKQAILKLDKVNKSLYYEYVDIPPQLPSVEERVSNVENGIAELTMMMATPQ